MTDTKVENSTTDSSANASAQTEQATTKTESVSEVNQRLLRESQEWKLKAQTEKREREKLLAKMDEEKGEYKKLYEDTQSKLSETMRKMVEKELKAAVKDAATKAGCVDVEAAFMMGDHKLLKLDEEAGEVVGADLFIESVKKTKPYLFQSQSQTRVNPAAPGGVGTKTLTPADVARLKAEEKNKAWAMAYGKK